MKKIGLRILAALIVSALFLLSSCTKHSVIVLAPKHAPPGQVKKTTGSQSAKAYAPGQQKKMAKHK